MVIFQCFLYRDLTKSCLSHSFRFPRLWTQHQEVMPKSCLSVFPHCERKRQNNPFQIRTFHFHPFFSSLCLRFTVSSLPTFFPKQVYLYGVLWVAMAPLHRKRPRQFVSSYSLKGLQSWVALFCFCLRACIPGMLSDYGLGALGRLVIQCYTLVSHLPPLVSHLQQQQQAEPRSSRQNLGAAGRT